MAELRPRLTLRLRVFLAVIAVVLLPLPLSWASNLADKAIQQSLAVRVDAAAASVEKTLGTQALDAARQAAEDTGSRYAVRVRVIPDESQGSTSELVEPLVDEGKIALPGDYPFAAMFFGLNPPSYEEADRLLGPLDLRPEVVAARGRPDAPRPSGSIMGSGTFARQKTGEARCDDAAMITVCAEARSVTLADGRKATLHVETMARRVFRLVYDSRYPLLAIVAFVAVIAAAIVLWLNGRIVTPLEQLRDRVVARRRGDRRSLLANRQDEIGDLARAFDDLVTALEERNRANAGFMADLVHEMKSSVSALRAVGEALEDGRMDPERAGRYARVIRDSSARLDGVVTRFLELARAEAGLPGQERVPVDLAALTAGVVEEFRASHPDVTFTVQAQPASVPAVQDGVETILRNLLDNAARFGREVVVRVALVGDVATVSVADDGPGIDANDLPKVFDRFFTRRPGGTGLGLALSQAIAHAHGGRLEVRSAPGRGAVFVLLLPRG